MQKLDRNLGLNRSTRLNGVIGLHDILIDEMKNREGNGEKKEKCFFFCIFMILHILHILHNQTPFVISFPETYHIIGLSVVLVFVFVSVLAFVFVFSFSKTKHF